MTKGSSPKIAAAETLVEHIIQSIRESIRGGEFAQGERMVVADIARRYGVSMGPVREAIRRLAGEGLLEFTPHRGATVRAYSERDIREIFQVREAIEGYAARLAAENIHRGDYAARLRGCQKRMNAAGYRNIAALTDARQQFHDLLYEFAANAALKEAAMRLTFPVNRLLFNKLTPKERLLASTREHDEVIDAVLAGDGVRAERAMRVHLHNGAIAICELLELSRAAASKKKV
jgi:DNA-binding GntR family transcriptional regulator